MWTPHGSDSVFHHKVRSKHEGSCESMEAFHHWAQGSSSDFEAWTFGECGKLVDVNIQLWDAVGALVWSKNREQFRLLCSVFSQDSTVLFSSCQELALESSACCLPSQNFKSRPNAGHRILKLVEWNSNEPAVFHLSSHQNPSNDPCKFHGFYSPE